MYTFLGSGLLTVCGFINFIKIVLINFYRIILFDTTLHSLKQGHNIHVSFHKGIVLLSIIWGQYLHSFHLFLFSSWISLFDHFQRGWYPERFKILDRQEIERKFKYFWPSSFSMIHSLGYKVSTNGINLKRIPIYLMNTKEPKKKHSNYINQRNLK